jgi:hypothetical protein
MPAACDTCVELTFGGEARVWIDATDRQSDDFADALSICRSLGGELASERDLVEGILRGVLAGSVGKLVRTATVVDGSLSSPEVVGLATVAIPWPAPADRFTAAVPSQVLGLRFDEPAAIRCMWTNELR